MDRVIGFDELRWLQELTHRTRRGVMPDGVGASLLARGLVLRNAAGFELTARGRIALAKLG